MKRGRRMMACDFQSSNTEKLGSTVHMLIEPDALYIITTNSAV